MPEFPSDRSSVRAKRAALWAAFLVALAAHTLAQSAPTNFAATEDIFLSTKTPLGDAAVKIPAGTVITNYEIQGKQIKVRQGAFSAVVALEDVQGASAATPVPTASPTPSPEATPDPTPAPQTAPAATPAPDPVTTSEAGKLPPLPDWLLPAAFGALAAYALLATLALLRSRSDGKVAAIPRDSETKDAPVVTLPRQTKAKPAVVADGGRAIACPLCGKNIPLEKVSQGRNSCPSCQGKFVGE